jgi:hypothetical protein
MPPVRLTPFDEGKLAVEALVASTSYLNEDGELDVEQLPEVYDPEGDEDSQ